jgi:hypothetical protein
MGGFGSGNWRRNDKRKLITGAYRLDIKNLKDELHIASNTGQMQGKAFLMPPLSSWFCLSIEPFSVKLAFDSDAGVTCQSVRVEKRACRFGGERFYFACPACGRLCLSLFREGDNFLCRVCFKLVYPVQNERRVAALNRSFRKARGRLVRDGQDNLMAYPARLKGMHRATYEAWAARQLALFDEKEDAIFDWIVAMFGRRVERIRCGRVTARR